MIKTPIDIEELLALIGEREVTIHLLNKRIALLEQALEQSTAVRKTDAKEG